MSLIKSLLKEGFIPFFFPTFSSERKEGVFHLLGFEEEEDTLHFFYRKGSQQKGRRSKLLKAAVYSKCLLSFLFLPLKGIAGLGSYLENPLLFGKQVDYIQVYPDIQAPDLSSTGNWRAKIILDFIKKSNKEDISRDISCKSLQEVVLAEIHMREIPFVDSIYPDILPRVKQLPRQVYSNWF